VGGQIKNSSETVFVEGCFFDGWWRQIFQSSDNVGHYMAAFNA